MKRALSKNNSPLTTSKAAIYNHNWAKTIVAQTHWWFQMTGWQNENQWALPQQRLCFKITKTCHKESQIRQKMMSMPRRKLVALVYSTQNRNKKVSMLIQRLSLMGHLKVPMKQKMSMTLWSDNLQMKVLNNWWLIALFHLRKIILH